MGKNVIWLYPKLEKWMGGTKFVFECAKRIAKVFPLQVICQKASIEIVDEFRKNDIEVHILNSKTFTDFTFWLNFSKRISEDLQSIVKFVDIDSVIITSMYPTNLIASHLSNKHIQIIYEPFSFFYRQDLSMDYGVKIDIFFWLIRRIFANTDITATQSADIVLTLSHFEKQNIKKIYGVESEIIYEGVDNKIFYPRDVTLLTRKYKDKIPLMHSTGFDTYKGTDLVINALPILKKKYPNFILFITYTRENKKKITSYNTFIKNNGLESNVKFLQFLPIDELPIYYSFARIYLEPGRGRSMSLSNKEAMACGTPVIRGNDSTEEVIDSFNGFLVPPDEPGKLVEKIITILEDTSLRETMSVNAISSVNSKFSWESVVEKIINHI